MKFDTFKKNSTRQWIALLVCAVLTVGWMAAIFGFSASDAQESTIQSHAVTEIIIKIFNPNFDNLPEAEQEDMIFQFDRIVRKIAHFVAYAILGFLMYFSFALALSMFCTRKPRTAVVSFPLCVLFAATDEYHQTFVDGRAGRLLDILIDSGGSAFGILLAVAVIMLLKKLSQNK